MASNSDGPELSGEAQRLIEASRGFDDPTPEDRERVKARWLASIAAGAGLSALGTAARAGGSAGWGMKAVGAIAALTVGGLALYALVPSRPAPTHEAPRMPAVEAVPAPAEEARRAMPEAPPAPEAAVEEKVVTPEAPTPAAAPPAPTPPAPRPSPVPARPVKAPPPAAAPESPPPSSQLSEELALIAEVRKSVQEGQSASALSLLEQYQGRFATPILGMEAAALRVDALCHAGEQSAARAAAADFEKKWPASPLSRRVAAACP